MEKIVYLIKKIKEYGCGVFFEKMYSYVLDKILYFIFRHTLPINRKLIIFESPGIISENTYTFYKYLCIKYIDQKYKIVWITKNKDIVKKLQIHAIFVPNDFTIHSLKRCLYLATAGMYIYDHNNFLDGTKRKGQIVVNFWHGIPIKGLKGTIQNNRRCNVDIAISTSDLSTSFMSKFCNISEKKYVNIGFPRNDYFFTDLSQVKNKLNREFSLSKYDKLCLWMPTYRQCEQDDLSENYMKNETGLPLINTKVELNTFNNFLTNLNILLLLKVHPLQANLPVFNEVLSNIRIVKDMDLIGLNVQLYQFVGISDFLITDYSSIAYDYLLLDKPMIFTVDDYEDYKLSRGFICDDILQYLVGMKTKTYEELTQTILSVKENIDPFKNERNILKHKIHKYIDGNSSKRIVELLEL